MCHNTLACREPQFAPYCAQRDDENSCRVRVHGRTGFLCGIVSAQEPPISPSVAILGAGASAFAGFSSPRTCGGGLWFLTT